MKYVLIGIVFLNFIIPAWGQRSISSDSVISIQQKKKEVAIQKAIALGWQPRIEYLDGTILEVVDYDNSGVPIYYKTHNQRASQSTKTSYLYTNGLFPLGLSGKNVPIAVWDGGAVLNSHVEIQSRTNQYDNPAGLSVHATHVTGTILAAGIDDRAKGMAFEAKANTYDFNSDDGEMINEAQKGLLISNHSYGAVLGWQYNPNNNSWTWYGDANISNQEDYRFGLYTSSSRSWDDISYKNPYYLIIKSAGNDRSDTGSGAYPADGPYDILDPQAVAKNILTVGAVESLASPYSNPNDVRMTSFSSWGPTDDGRIKPDIVGVGANLYSSSSASNTSYASLSGTSMSAPNVTGSLVLLQELFKKQTSKFLKASTLKALAIHTAKESGSFPGPDFQFGWGLLDVLDASKLILLNGSNGSFIKEDILINQQEVEYKLYLGQNQDFKATITWTDIPGAAITQAVLDPTNTALINDLDIVVETPTGEKIYPWRMNLSTYRAERGNNNVDNTEKIEFITTDSGSYKLIVSHKASLVSGSQNYSLIVSSSKIENSLTAIFFTGSDNNLNNAANWAANTPTSNQYSIPSKNSLAIIDTDLFDRDTLKLSSNLSVMGLIVKGDRKLVIDLQSNYLIFSSWAEASNDKLIIINGNIQFEGHGQYSRMNWQGESENINLLVKADSGNLLIENLPFIKVLSVKQGGLKFLNGHNYTFDKIEVDDNEKTYIDFNGANFTLTTLLAPGKNIVSTQTNINLVTGFDNSSAIVVDTLEVGKLTVLSDSVSLNAFLKSDSLLLNGLHTYLGNSSNIGVLKLFSTNTFQIKSGERLTLNDLILQDPTKRKVISSQEEAEIFSNMKNKICLENIEIDHVNIEGTTFFVIDNQSVINNATGWIQAVCEDVIDAKFTYTNSCVESFTEFSDISEGQPVSWFWDFGVVGIDTDTSTLPNPEYQFTSEGSFIVSLTITDSIGEISKIVSEVNIQKTTLRQPSIEDRDGTLYCVPLSNNYQWYLDSEPLLGENSFKLSRQYGPGEYQVAISNNQCHFVSRPFVIAPLAVEKYITSRHLLIYPNPNNGSFEIEIPPLNLEAVSIMVVNLSGTIVYHQSIDKNETIVKLNLDHLPSGLFLIKLKARGANLHANIIIQK